MTAPQQQLDDNGLASHPRRCTARSRRQGGQCRAYAIKGGSICVAHGGRAPQVKAAAKRRLAVAAALKTVDLFGQPDTEDAVGILSREVASLSTFTGALQEFLSRLSPDDALVGEGRQVLDLWRQSQATLIRTSRDVVALSLEERSRRMTEMVGTFMRDLLRAMVDAAGLSVEQREQISALINRELRALSSALTLEASA